MGLGDMVVGGTHYYVYIGGMAEDRFFSNVLPPTAYPPPIRPSVTQGHTSVTQGHTSGSRLIAPPKHLPRGSIYLYYI